MIELNKIYNEDCLEGMKRIPDKSVDMILCDLPYGTTACKWDSIIPFNELWEQYERIIKDNGAIVLTASQPFTTELIHSNLKLFKYCWVWNKKKAGNIFLAKYQPMKIHEDIVVFSKKTHKYNPIKTPRDKIKRSKNYGTGEAMGGDRKKEDKVYEYTDKNPVSIIEVSNAVQKGKIHPTQKPVELFEYLIKTYTDEEDIVLDNCMGSGTTAVACINTNRNFIGFELDKHYCDIANERIRKALAGKEVGE
ncbi:MAG TPA: site-specific DNA-methyltransferase [archaeon]|nr:site-specific DNA-methyltransferase [archaeon]